VRILKKDTYLDFERKKGPSIEEEGSVVREQKIRGSKSKENNCEKRGLDRGQDLTERLGFGFGGGFGGVGCFWVLGGVFWGVLGWGEEHAREGGKGQGSREEKRKTIKAISWEKKGRSQCALDGNPREVVEVRAGEGKKTRNEQKKVGYPTVLRLRRESTIIT